MKIIFFGFLVLVSISVFYLDDNILSYAEDKEIVIRDEMFKIDEYASGFRLPVMMDFIGDHVLVAEKDGNVRIIKDGVLVAEPVLQLEVSTTMEEGLVGILVKNNDVFIHHTTHNLKDGSTSNWFTKYHYDGIILREPVELLSFHNGVGWHNSGIMIEDKNGIVYGAIGDSENEAGLFQNVPSGPDNNTGSIISLEDTMEVYAIGIRNTYGLDFDPVTGILWDTENGPESFDEINLVQEKFNSGWNVIQGPSKDEQKIPHIDKYEYSDPEFSWERPIGVTEIHFICLL